MEHSKESPFPHYDTLKTQIRNLDETTVPSGILSLPIYNPLDKTKDSILTYAQIGQCISELKFGMVNDQFNLLTFSEMREKARSNQEDNTVQMVSILADFHRFKNGPRRQLSLDFQKGESPNINEAVDASKLQKETVFIAAPLSTNIPDGAEAVFNFSEEFNFYNRDKPLKIDFDPDDGKGVRTIQSNEKVKVSYTSTGEKTIRVKTNCDDTIFEYTSTLDVLYINLPKPDQEYFLAARYHYKVKDAAGKVRIYYSDKSRGLVKPLFFWTGFDTGVKGTSTFNSPFDLMERNGLELFATQYDRFLKVALDNGHDIVTLDWNNSRDYIQNNGFLAATLIQKLRREFPNSEKGTIVTGSMGGLIARWTALYMENEGKALFGEHHLAKIITLDTPHEGAVMPIALQYAIGYIAYFVKTSHGDAAREGLKVINSPAASQMLVQQLVGGWPEQHLNAPGHHKEREILLETWKGWKQYPKDLETYAVSSGSRLAQGQSNSSSETLKPGGMLLKGHQCALNVFRLMACPDFPENSQKGQNILGLSLAGFFRRDMVIKKTLPYDSCPGGYYDFISQLGNALNVDEMPFTNTCFIPATSSVGIESKDLYQTIDPEQPGPFKGIYIPEKNEQHASLTAGNKKWIFEVLGIT
ncbi:MAG: hypothetical protein AAF489_00995 [Bacteroidota bacterium]